MATGLASEKRLFLARLAKARDTAEGGPKKRLLKQTAATLVIVAMLAVLVLWAAASYPRRKNWLKFEPWWTRRFSNCRR